MGAIGITNVEIFKRTQTCFLASFALVILLGALALKCPPVHCQGGLKPVDALFTSTSAVCVTGLSVVDTSKFNLPGQIVIMALMQIGGIGIMTLTSSMLLFMRGELGYGSKLMVSNVNNVFSMKEVDSILKVIVKYTIMVEFVGFCGLFVAFSFDDPNLPSCAYKALFHSISAFCNAGFSTFDESLCSSNVAVKAFVAGLVIAGGLGYYAALDLMRNRMNPKARLKIHTRLVVFMTVSLILGGFALIKLFDWPDISFIDAMFQSITARTAGFNTVDLASLHSTSILVIMVLMVIGASPGSTGGGIKTTTAAVAFFAVYNVFKGRTEVHMFKRRVPEENILKAFAIALVYLMAAFVATAALLHFEKAAPIEAGFEVISALSTVGLSLGLSMKAGFAGKVILILCMYVGRVGPTAFLFFLMSHQSKSKLQYPEEELILG